MEPFKDLVRILREEMDCFKRLLYLLGREKGLLIKGDLKALTELLKEKETLSLKVKVLEEARLGLMKEVGASLGVREGELTCSRLARFAPSPYASLFETLLGEFKHLIGQTAELHVQNGILLEGLLQYTRSLLNLFTPLAYGSTTYREDGLLEGGRPEAKLFNRLA